MVSEASVIPCVAAKPHFCAFLGLAPAFWMITSVCQLVCKVSLLPSLSELASLCAALSHTRSCQHQGGMLLLPLLIMLLCNIILSFYTWGLSLSTLKDSRVHPEILLQSFVVFYLMCWTERLHEVCILDLKIFKEEIMIHSILSWNTVLPLNPQTQRWQSSTMWDPSAEMNMSNGQSG